MVSLQNPKGTLFLSGSLHEFHGNIELYPLTGFIHEYHRFYLDFLKGQRIHPHFFHILFSVFGFITPFFSCKHVRVNSPDRREKNTHDDHDFAKPKHLTGQDVGVYFCLSRRGFLGNFSYNKKWRTVTSG